MNNLLYAHLKHHSFVDCESNQKNSSDQAVRRKYQTLDVQHYVRGHNIYKFNSIQFRLKFNHSLIMINF